MGSVPMRISRISENLRVIQEEISSLAEADLEPGLGEETFSENDVRALKRMKASVDHMRRMLWTYIDYANSQTLESQEVRSARMERATHILHYACMGLAMRERPGREVPQSLFEQLMALAFRAVERSMEPPESQTQATLFPLRAAEELVGQAAAD